MTGRPQARRIAAALVVAATLALPARPTAHDIPTDVLVQAFVKPEARRLRLLVRVPLGAVPEINYPTWGAGYLDLARADAALHEAAALWIADYADLYENDVSLGRPRVLAARASLPSDKSFGAYEDALAHVTTGPRLPADLELYWNQAMLDALVEYPIQSDRSEFSIQPGLERFGMRVTSALQFVMPDGVIRGFQFHGDPGLIRLDPRWHQAALHFVELGFFHILDGVDHLLFLLCLVIPFRRFRTLVLVVTSFTVAHSITLLASALEYAPGALWFPPLVETLIAVSIVYMALENIVAANLRRRWIITFGFGLIHGFGFSFVLRETLQFAGPHLLTSLVSFNIGVELGQLLVLVLAVPMLGLLFRHLVAERTGTIILSVLVAHTGWHWMTERWAELQQFPFPWPDAILLALLIRWAMVALIVAGVVWFVFGVLRPRPAARARDEATTQ